MVVLQFLPSFCARHPGFDPLGARPLLRADSRPARPSHAGSAVTCASTFVKAGSAAVAGSFGGSASG